MTSISEGLAKLLARVDRPGDFFTAGTTELLTPSLQVDGVGPVALPLLPVQAASLIAVAEAAPYGRGEETLVDPAVRRTWQIASGTCVAGPALAADTRCHRRPCVGRARRG